MSWTTPFLLLSVLTVPQVLLAQPFAVDNVELAGEGIYDIEIVGRIAAGNSPGGVRNVVGRAGLVDRTTAVSARSCVSFGFEYLIRGAPVGAEVPIRMVTRFPPEGIRNPKTGIVSHVTEALVPRTIGRHHYRVYTFDEPWEIVPGVWTFEIWYQDRKLAERHFSVSGECATDCATRRGAGACAAPLVAFASPSASQRIVNVPEEPTGAIRR